MSSTLWIEVDVRFMNCSRRKWCAVNRQFSKDRRVIKWSALGHTQREIVNL